MVVILPSADIWPFASYKIMGAVASAGKAGQNRFKIDETKRLIFNKILIY